MGIAEILAKKKAEKEALAAAQQVVHLEPSGPAPISLINNDLNAPVEEPISTHPGVITPVDIINTEVAVTQVPKPISFAERMAQKNAPAKVASIPAPAPAVQIVPTPAKVDTSTPVAQPVSLAASSHSEEGVTETSPETEQAYADIKAKIDELVNLSDTPLAEGMKTLKEALLKNPNAVALMEDTDFGKMVVALRNLTKEAAVEATKEKTPGRKKSKTLSPEELAAALEEI